ncbi:MAG: hypothetical protein C0423_16375 [Methylibium sp.]|nr:hypothetical protein [Methylibium sp.]
MTARPPLAPHRPLFMIGGLLWIASSTWWMVQLLQPVPMPLPTPGLHSLLISLSFMPCFIAGFAFTVVPRWLGLPPVDARCLGISTTALLLGWLLALVAARPLASAEILAGGLTLAALGLAGLAGQLLALCRQAAARDAVHAYSLAAALALCAVALAIAAASAALMQPLLLRQAVRLGLWFGVASVFAVALQRLTPFLHQEGRRAPWLLLLLLGGLWLRGALDLAAPWLAEPPAWLALPAALACASLSALLLRASLRRELAAALRTPLLAQLHLGLLWLVLSFALEAAALLLASVGQAGRLGLLPLHALSLGFMGSTLLAMVSRVSAVQHGRSVAVDALLWGLQGLLQVLTLARLLGAVAPGLLAPAATGFALLALGWTLRYGPWLLRGRANTKKD